MNRRGFLGAIAGGLVLDPERLLWRPGAKLISIPAPRIPYTDGVCVAAEIIHGRIRQSWTRDRGVWSCTTYDDAGPRIISRETWVHSPPPFVPPALREYASALPMSVARSVSRHKADA